MNRIFFALVALVMVTLISCNANYKKSKSGMEYKVFSGKASGVSKDAMGKEMKPGNIVKFNFSFSVARKGKADTILNNTYEMMPQYAPYDTSAQIMLTPIEPLLYTKVGDSVEFRISVDSLIAKQMIPENEIYAKGATIKGKLSVLDVFATEDLAKADFEKEAKAFEAREEARKKVAIVEESKAIEKYLKEKKITATKTAMGTYVLIENPGTGQKLDSGKVAVVKYKGYTLDGKVFDSNMDTTRPNRGAPLEVLIGAQQSIPGFEDGLTQFAKGAKGKIFIPASLGYGNRAMPELPANSNLIFDIEVTDVKNAPAQAAQPQLTPEQMQELQKQLQQQGGAAPQSSTQPGHEGHNHP